MRVFHALCTVFALIASAGASTPRLDDITEILSDLAQPHAGGGDRGECPGADSDGYLWIATPSGLYRFDGVRFDRIDSIGTVRLLGEGIQHSWPHVAGRGLWIGL